MIRLKEFGRGIIGIGIGRKSLTFIPLTYIPLPIYLGSSRHRGQSLEGDTPRLSVAQSIALPLFKRMDTAVKVSQAWSRLIKPSKNKNMLETARNSRIPAKKVLCRKRTHRLRLVGSSFVILVFLRGQLISCFRIGPSRYSGLAFESGKTAGMF
jgi:hypothetical protein